MPSRHIYMYKNGRGGALMKDYIRRRVMSVGAYVIQTEATVRQAARVYDVSKSTIHKDLTERLPSVDKELAEKVRRVLATNKAERHIRGGEVTRRKYKGTGRRKRG